MTRTYHVEPQRATGRGWQACEPHRAERWAVVSRTRSRRGVVSRVEASYTHRKFADMLQESLTRAATPVRRPTLGQRFVRTGRAIIAGSRS